MTAARRPRSAAQGTGADPMPPASAGAVRAAGRPATGVGHYMRDIIYGALDGGITTLAIVAAVAGAGLGLRVALILGMANLVADGISMGASNYLGLKSELEQKGLSVAREMPWRHGAATFVAFVAAGIVPLAGYVAVPWPAARLWVAAALAAVVFYGTGAARARFLHRSRVRCGLEMLVIGLAAGAASFGVGVLADRFV